MNFFFKKQNNNLTVIRPRIIEPFQQGLGMHESLISKIVESLS